MDTVTVTERRAVQQKRAERSLGEIFRVYGNIGTFTRSNLAVLWLGLFLFFWFFSPIKALPYPGEVVRAIHKMWAEQHLLNHIGVTLKLNVWGLIFSSLASLAISYLSVIPFFQPFNKAIQVLRYIPIVGFTLVFLSLFAIGWPTKVAMLTT